MRTDGMKNDSQVGLKATAGMAGVMQRNIRAVTVEQIEDVEENIK